ncbi:DSD1 family PLP-dependent enzyme [soil metagenome]
MHRNIRIGMAEEELETPVLVIDIESMERNLAKMMGILEGSDVRLRPHLKTAKSPALAWKMIDAGAVGVCCAKLSEAEVMANAGIQDILLTSEVAGAGKFERLVALAARLRGFKAVVDSNHAIKSINNVAVERGVTVNLMIEVDVKTGRSGVVSAADALELANQIRDLQAVDLVGLHGYAGHAQVRPAEERQELNPRAMEVLQETIGLLQEHNHELTYLSGGGTGSVALDVEAGVLNEVQAGSFLLMDTAYRNAGAPFENAISCLSTIISRPNEVRAVCDAGLKTLSRDAGPPEVIDRPGVTYLRGSDEHGNMEVDPGSLKQPLDVGDVVRILPSHVCTTINLHDVLVGVRDGVVEAVWPVEARGHVW